MATGLPFSRDQFFDVFARYNAAVWTEDLGLLAAGLRGLTLLVRSAALREKGTAAGTS